MWWTRVFEYRASSGTGLVRRQFQNKKGIKAAIKRDNPGVEDLTTVPRWARVRDGWIMGSSEAWVTSRLVAFSNKRDASS